MKEALSVAFQNDSAMQKKGEPLGFMRYKRMNMLLISIFLCGFLLIAPSSLASDIGSASDVSGASDSSDVANMQTDDLAEQDEFIFVEVTTSPPPSQTALPQADKMYENNGIRIEITKHEIPGTIYFTVELWLSDITQLRSAFSSGKFDAETETVWDIAQRNNAIFAFNGDFATFNNGGIIIRNGELFRTNKSTRQMLMIDQNGDFQIMVDSPQKPKEKASEMLADGIWHTCVFGPVLVENSMPVKLPKDFFISTKGALEPRTAIAQLGPLHYLVIIADGRLEGYSEGLSLSQLQELFMQYSAITAFNLDGGGSTTLYFNGEVLNVPATGHLRRVPDIFYIAK